MLALIVLLLMLIEPPASTPTAAPRDARLPLNLQLVRLIFGDPIPFSGADDRPPPISALLPVKLLLAMLTSPAAIDIPPPCPCESPTTFPANMVLMIFSRASESTFKN